MTMARLIRTRSVTMISCTGTMPVREAVALLADKRIGALPVFDGDTLRGVFSERDVIQQLRELGPSMLDRTVSEAMSTPAITVTPEVEVLEALALMTHRRIRHLPVVEDGRVIAFVSIGDLVKYRLDHLQSETEAMREFIQMG
ncbi:MAG: CBS domain-containing protein [Sphingomonadales bacterium]|nr:CBS domain-containing protein [Sphingomonadales bacterium]